MTIQPEQEYYLARMAAERTAADLAQSEEARTVHLELAEHYRRIVDGEQDRPPPLE